MNLYEYLDIYIFICSTKTRQERRRWSGFPDVRGMHARLDLGNHRCWHGWRGLSQRGHRRFAVKAPTRVAISSEHLNRRQYPALKAHQTTGIGLGRVPAHHEVGALPTIGPLKPGGLG